MSDSPSLSVIVPVYNAQHTLPRCLESLVNQTLSSLEIICVNDGSTDGSLELLRSYARRDKRVIVIDQPNSGSAGKPRNIGLRHVRAPFVTFVDADDYMETDAYARLLPLMEDGIDLLRFGAHVENENPNPYDDFYRSLLDTGEDRIDEAGGAFYFSSDPHIWNKIFKTSLLREHGITFPEGVWAEDTAFLCMYCLFTRRVRHCSRKYYHYVRSSSSHIGQLLARKCSRNIVESILTTERVYCCMKENRCFSQQKEVLFRYMAQRAGVARCHATGLHAWRIYLILVKYMATIWLRSPQTVFSLMWGKWKTGAWPDFHSATPSTPAGR